MTETQRSFVRLHDRLVEPTSFWSCAIKGTTVTITRGPLDTPGKSTTKSLASEEAAQQFARKKLDEKISQGFVDATLRFEVACWQDVASTLRASSNAEEPDDRVLVWLGDTRLPHSLWIDYREGILKSGEDEPPFAGILVRGDLDIDGALYGWEDDHGPFLQVQGNLRARAIATGGARIHVGGDLVTEELVGVYNHGHVAARGRISARIIATEHSVDADGGVHGLRYLGWGANALSVHENVEDESDPYEPAGVFAPALLRDESVDLGLARRWAASGRSILVPEPTSIRRDFARKMSSKLASWEKVKTLSLAGKGLTVLPDELFTFRNLEKLDLTHCRLRALPEKLGELTKLRELRLRGNGLQRLPESIGNLHELTLLDLEANCIVDLPPALARCTKLKTVILTNNPYSYVRRAFGGWDRVELMWKLPEVLFELPALERLTLDQTFIRSLPAGTPASTKLRVERVRSTLLPESEARRFPEWGIDAASSVERALFYVKSWLRRDVVRIERFYDPLSGRYDFTETDALLRLLLHILIPTSAPYEAALAAFEEHSTGLARDLNPSGNYGEQVRQLFRSFLAVLDAVERDEPQNPLTRGLHPIFAAHAGD